MTQPKQSTITPVCQFTVVDSQAKRSREDARQLAKYLLGLRRRLQKAKARPTSLAS